MLPEALHKATTTPMTRAWAVSDPAMIGLSQSGRLD